MNDLKSYEVIFQPEIQFSECGEYDAGQCEITDEGVQPFGFDGADDAQSSTEVSISFFFFWFIEHSNQLDTEMYIDLPHDDDNERLQ